MQLHTINGDDYFIGKTFERRDKYENCDFEISLIRIGMNYFCYYKFNYEKHCEVKKDFVISKTYLIDSS